MRPRPRRPRAGRKARWYRWYSSPAGTGESGPGPGSVRLTSAVSGPASPRRAPGGRRRLQRGQRGWPSRALLRSSHARPGPPGSATSSRFRTPSAAERPAGPTGIAWRLAPGAGRAWRSSWTRQVNDAVSAGRAAAAAAPRAGGDAGTGGTARCRCGSPDRTSSARCRPPAAHPAGHSCAARGC